MLRYPGGKSGVVDILEDILVNDEKQDLTNMTLISPFFGGGSFELHLNKKYGCKVIANDLFKPLATFWTEVKQNPILLSSEIQALRPMNKDKFKLLRERIMDETGVRQAADFFAINRSSFSGATLSGGYSNEAAQKRFTDNSVNKIQSIDLTDFKFYNHDWKEFLDLVLNDSKQIIFLDPPYALGDGSKLYGNNGDLHSGFDHEGLADYLSGLTGWMLCYNECDWIKKLYPYEDQQLYRYSHNYGMNSKKSNEMIISNF
jgi:DNA adenine methylase